MIKIVLEAELLYKRNADVYVSSDKMCKKLKHENTSTI